ncbi:MAG: hypothetical protein EXR32_01885 [Betaproteobacteria bacterium]|nr:hypothetical protein [Betaproteobacteria bacterium]
MKLNLAPLLGAALLCGSLAVNAQAPAQTPAGDPGKGEARKEMRAKMKTAHEACKDHPDRHACMTESKCAKSSDPAKCQAQAKERHAKMRKHMDERQVAHEACTGKRGDELMKCLGAQHQKSGHAQHDKKR